MRPATAGASRAYSGMSSMRRYMGFANRRVTGR